MPGEVEFKTIQGVTYGVRPLLALTGATVLARVMSLISLSDIKLDGGAPLEQKLTQTVGLLLDKALHSPSFLESVPFFCTTFAQYSFFRQGEKEVELRHNFDAHFQQNYSALLQWLMFCFQVNFGAVFLGLKSDLVSSATRAKE